MSKMMTPPPVIVPVPTAFAARWTPSFNVLQQGRAYSTNLNFSTLIPAVTVTYYVDPIGGSDSNSGLTRSLPLLNLGTALAKSDVDQVRIINLTRDFVSQINTASWNNRVMTRSVSVINESNIYRYISGAPVSAAALSWSVNGTYSNVYQATRSGVNNIIDCAQKTYPSYTNQSGNLVTISNAIPAYGLGLKAKVASLAACAAQAGSWYTDGTTIYVRPFDDRNLTQTVNNRTITYSGAQNNGRGPTANGINCYIEGIDFVGGTTTFFCSPSTATFANQMAFKNCSFQHSTTGNAFAMQGKISAYSTGCACYYGYADGFNYHSFEQNGTNTPNQCYWLEQNSVSWNNGTTGSAGASDNASTTHDYTAGIRVNNIYCNSDDRPMADTDHSMTWNLGTFVGSAINQASGGTDANIACLVSATQWLDGCSVSTYGSINAPYISESAPCTIYYRNMSNVTNASGAAGTITTY